MPIVIPRAATTHATSATITRAGEWPRFAVIVVEFALIVLLVQQFHLESQTFYDVMRLSLAGFVIHHLLPLRLRLPFFAILSLLVTVTVVEGAVVFNPTGPGVIIIVLGAALLAICHLPIQVWWRVGLLLLAATVFAVARANEQWFPKLESMWPILASMFVFRTMVYLYDLHHQSAEFDIARSISYFYMLPNACFPLFPIVDYKTYCSTYYNDDPHRIYQTGVKWMFRGVVHLLLYRLVYHLGVLDIAEVRDLGDVAQFMVATYMLYLRVSGQFHLIVGLLHMFGFNLPETHHLYFLASSFTDFWRRINIYWKDFIMKLFFYPAFFALRNRGTVKAIALGTLVAFFATWLLHSWQWFWFLGKFLWTWQDILFWSILALLVLVNAVIEALRGRQRTLAKPSFDWRAGLTRGLKTAATFVVICALWTLWSSHSFGELKVLAESALNASLSDVVLIGFGLTTLGVAGAIWGSSAQVSSVGKKATDSVGISDPLFQWSTVEVIVGAACALMLSVSEFPRGSRAETLQSALSQDRMNAVDLDQQRRGYYEELDEVRATQLLWSQITSAPPGWTNDRRLCRKGDGFIRLGLVPSTTAMYCGTPATTNAWGMRDREYQRQKPMGTVRFILLGGSHEAGCGVKDLETFENLLEDRLNGDEAAGGRYEILNMSIPGTNLFEKLLLLEGSGFDFEPDAILFTINSSERQFIVGGLAGAITNKRPIPYAYLKQLFQEVSVNDQMEKQVIQHRLEPRVLEMYDWVFRRLKRVCEQRGVYPVVIFRPAPNPLERHDPSNIRDLITSAAGAGLNVLDLSSIYSDAEDWKRFILAEWDQHTNAAGHRLLADELYKQLAPIVHHDIQGE